MLDAKLIIFGIIEHYNNIKTSIMVVKLRILLTIYLCDSGNVPLLGVRDIIKSTLDRVIRACFYFNKY